jgi:hypothetical protein
MPKVRKVFDKVIRKGLENSRVQFTDGSTALVPNRTLAALNLTLPNVALEVRQFAAKALNSGRANYTVMLDVANCYLKLKNLKGNQEAQVPVRAELKNLFTELGREVTQQESNTWMRTKF